MDAIAQAISDSWLDDLILSKAWIWPTLEIFHFAGLSLLLGALIIIDLRLVGFFKRVPIKTVHSLLPLAATGFAINLMSGILFFIGDPFRYVANFGFWTKMSLVAVAGINAAWYAVSFEGDFHKWDNEAAVPIRAQVIAFVSLSAWTGVLVFGRLIPFVGTG